MTNSITTPSINHSAFLGLDVGKESHWAYAINSQGTMLLSKRVDNRDAALDALLAELPKDTLVIVDQFRNIGALAIKRARVASYDVAYLPGSAEHDVAKNFPGDAKTDERDAQVIARTALGMPHMLRCVPEELDPKLEAARLKSSQIEFSKRERTACVNALRSLLLESCPAFEAVCNPTERWCAGILSEMGSPWAILDAGRRKFVACARRHGATPVNYNQLWYSIEGTRPVDEVVKAESDYLRHLAKRILESLAYVEELKEEVAELLKDNIDYRNLLTIPGIGPATARQLVISIDITKFDSHDKLASYCGVAPSTQQSGKSLKHEKAARGGNRDLKNVLIYSCKSLHHSKSVYGDYYRLLKAKGKKGKRAWKAVARKRMKVIYAVLRDGVPYKA